LAGGLVNGEAAQHGVARPEEVHHVVPRDDETQDVSAEANQLR
jgi:hypothetical protein